MNEAIMRLKRVRDLKHKIEQDPLSFHHMYADIGTVSVVSKRREDLIGDLTHCELLLEHEVELLRHEARQTEGGI